MKRVSRLLDAASSTPELTAVIFDLDQTLYWSAAFKTATLSQAAVCAAESLGLATEEAARVIEIERNRLEELQGYRPALSYTLVQLGIALNTWARYQERVEVEALVVSDPRVSEAVESVHKRFRTILYTNMCRSLTDRMIRHLGVAGVFDHVLTPQETGSAKPDGRVYQSLAQGGVIRVESTLSVGDRYEM